MEQYKQEFIEFMIDCQALKFGDFTLKSGRKSPFFMNAGAGIYWTSYFLVMNQMDEALTTGYGAVKCAGGIVLGIVLAFEIPQRFFRITEREM